MFGIRVEDEFCASHQLRLPDGTLEPLHGHNFHVSVMVCSPALDALQTVMDFHALQQALGETLAALNNQHLNRLAAFSSAINPSAERIAEFIGRQLIPAIPAPAALTEVSITEAPGCTAFWRP